MIDNKIQMQDPWLFLLNTFQFVFPMLLSQALENKTNENNNQLKDLKIMWTLSRLSVGDAAFHVKMIILVISTIFRRENVVIQ